MIIEPKSAESSGAGRMQNRTLLYIIIGVCAAVLLSCAGLFVTAFLLYQSIYSIPPAAMNPPPGIQSPGVVLGSDALQRTVFIDDPGFGIGTATDFKANPDPQHMLGIAGMKGAIFVDAQGAISKQITFPIRTSHVDFVGVDGDGNWEYLDRGGSGWSDATFFDATGKTLWTYGGMPGLDDMAAGDVDGDGIVDFIAGFNGSGGVRRLNKIADVQWTKPDGNVWHVEIVDTDGDGKSEIVHTSTNPQATVRDAGGNVLRLFTTPTYCSDFSLCRWPTSKRPLAMLAAADGQIWLCDFTGKTLAQFVAPNCVRHGHAYGTPARLKKGEPESLAVVVDYENWDASVLYIFDTKQSLIYHEVLPGRSAAIISIPSNVEGVDDLYVGGTGVIWKYAATNSNGQTNPKDKTLEDNKKTDVKN